MKQLIKECAVVGISLFLIPIIIIYSSGYNRQNILTEIRAEQVGQVEQEATLLDESLIMPILAKEISYKYEYEAIKAQAVIIRTYMARRALGMQVKAELSGYTEEEMKQLWQNEYESIYEMYKEAIEETSDEMMFYNRQPIQPLYHKSNGGLTRNAKDVYDIEVPYLVSVESQDETNNTQMKLSKNSIVEALSKKYPELVADEKNLENQIQIIEKDEAGYIKSIQVGNVILSGEAFKTLLGLESSNFRIYLSGDHFIFDVIGSGRGLGLSQNGANEMAKQGKNYKDILAYYYSGIEIKTYNEVSKNN
ncbi:SpoIID/LytB domain-containing protein [Cellulosilyticum ruminicola]|uniref:SpoIID/LytB domain-containing protein n=1 Tax=Cellulosilyticum ruminicola TaxID=425254 RepID=UPI0006CFBC61|nr:SpoIID/LytB domain-containing protein [Cellulosilyticum ruminicola]